MIKKLDIYILKKFLGSFAFVMMLLAAISVVIDLSEKIDDLIENDAPLGGTVTNYYFNFVPHIIALLCPFFVFITVIFFTSQMANRSEIVAILSSRISFNRLMRPFFIGAFILASLLLYANHFLVPKSNVKRLQFENMYINKAPSNFKRHIHRQISPGEFIYVQSYNEKDSAGRRFTLERFSDGTLIYKLRCEKIIWQRRSNKWRLQNYFIREFSDTGMQIYKGNHMDTVLNFFPGDFSKRVSMKEELTTPELTAHVDKMKRSGEDNFEFYLIEKHRRTSSAFSVFILTMIGASIASRKQRGGMGLHIVWGIVLSAGYEVIMKFSTTFSTNASLPPLIGVWIPNLVFLLIAIYLYRTAPK